MSSELPHLNSKYLVTPLSLPGLSNITLIIFPSLTGLKILNCDENTFGELVYKFELNNFFSLLSK